MSVILTGAVLALLVTMSFAVIRALLGPTIYDQLLAVNVFGTKTVLLLALYGFATGRPDFLDVALVYAMINFVGTTAVLRFFEYRHVGHRHVGHRYIEHHDVQPPDAQRHDEDQRVQHQNNQSSPGKPVN